jgi:hypothetical protein
MTLLKEDLGNQIVENIYQDLQIDPKLSVKGERGFGTPVGTKDMGRSPIGRS